MTAYIYTEKAEETARELMLDERKAGMIAMLGYKPLNPGITADAWIKKGYVSEIKLNDMCYGCKRLGHDCKGTECQTWTGCAYKTV